MSVVDRVRAELDALSPRAILAIGWLGLMVYAYPGFMSYDSVLQLEQARAGVYGGGHPPMMGLVWALTDAIVAGPLGMLVIQVSCFLGGAYLLLRRAMTERRAAICATLLLWFPPVAAVMGVIWKDAQMAAFLVLGAALLMSPRRAVRVAGLALCFLATAMRYNALAITLPLVLLLFAWSPAYRWWQRYAIAIAAWALVTLAASVVNDRLTAPSLRRHLWHDGLALLDLVGTLRYADDLPDAEVREALAGTPLRVTTDLQAAARASYAPETVDEARVSTFGTGSYVPALWVTTYNVFAPPTTAEHRAAIARAWRRLVLGNPAAYLAYRARVFRERVHLGDDDIPSGAYVWFADVLDLEGSTRRLGHNATTSRLQLQLRDAMLWLGTTWLFRPWIYLALSLVLVALCRRHRDVLALALSGLANEAALFVLAPTIDYRYSFWLVVSTALTVVMLIARRARPDQGPASR